MEQNQPQTIKTGLEIDFAILKYQSSTFRVKESNEILNINSPKGARGNFCLFAFGPHPVVFRNHSWWGCAKD